MKKKSIGMLVLFVVMVWIAVNISQAQEDHNVYLPVSFSVMNNSFIGEPPMPGGQNAQ